MTKQDTEFGTIRSTPTGCRPAASAAEAAVAEVVAETAQVVEADCQATPTVDEGGVLPNEPKVVRCHRGGRHSHDWLVGLGSTAAAIRRARLLIPDIRL